MLALDPLRGDERAAGERRAIARLVRQRNRLRLSVEAERVRARHRARAGGRELGVKDTKQLAMFTGIFNLLWAAVTIIMIVRPGSTLGH